MSYNFLLRLDVWSALLGLVGTILIFFWGLPPKNVYRDACEPFTMAPSPVHKKKAMRYIIRSYIGLSCLVLSFATQLINVSLTSRKPTTEIQLFTFKDGNNFLELKNNENNNT